MAILSSGIRRGVTLVELLVVMIIMVILATIVVAFGPSFQNMQKVFRGADQMQGWLLTARQWAKKDRLPTGIRLSVTAVTQGSTTSYYATDLQYIQQPSIYTVPYAVPASAGQPASRRISVATTGSLSIVTLDVVGSTGPLGSNQTLGEFSGGLAATQPQTSWPIQVNDYLVIHQTPCLVAGLSASDPTKPTLFDTITLASALPGNLGAIVNTTDYYFVRTPRALSGESTLKLPQDIIVDLNSNMSIPPVTATNATANYDILFSPSGELLAPVSSNKVILWVRDMSKLNTSTTDDTLIAIDVRTGMIAAHPVNFSGDSYLFTKDGRSSGL